MGDRENDHFAPHAEQINIRDQADVEEARLDTDEGSDSEYDAGQACGTMNDEIRAWSVQKPRLMGEKDDIRLFVEDFDNFACVVGLPSDIRYSTFVSYLPAKFRLKLRSSGLTDGKTKKWSKMKSLILKALTPPSEKLDAQLKLDAVKQEAGESVDDFVDRLRLLVEKCYNSKSEIPFRERILRDALTRGLADSQVRIEVLTDGKIFCFNLVCLEGQSNT